MMDQNAAHYLLFLIPLLLLCSIPIRLVNRKFKTSFPPTIFLFPLSFVIGTIMYHNSSLFVITTIPPTLIMGIYLPVHIFFIVYSMDNYIFMKCLPHVLLIALSIVTVMTILIGIIIRDVMHNEVNYSDCLIAAVVCAPIQPANVISTLKDLAKYKYMGVMLELESLFSIIQVMSSLQVSFGHLDLIQSKWYQPICVYVRYIIVAIIFGYIIGKIGGKLMAHFYNAPKNVVTISITMSFLTYFIAENILFTSGPLSVVLVSLVVKQERHRFTIEVENCMTYFWGILSYLWDKIFLMFLGVISMYYFWLFFDVTHIFGSAFIFGTANITRFAVFLVLYPILNAKYNNFDIRCMIVLGCSGVKGIVNLMLIYFLLTNRSSSSLMRHFLLDLILYMYLTIFINSAIMNLILSILRITQLSSTRKSNMNNCMQYISQKRMNNINIFKLNRYFSNVNWKMVRKETIVNHPYKDKENEGTIEEEEEEEQDDEVLLASSVCPDCINEVPYDISEIEIKEMIKDSYIKVLKAKKVSIIKQFENGVINKNCLQMLSYSFELLIEWKSERNNINLQNYLKKNKFLEGMHYIVTELNKEVIHVPPESLLRRLCFYIVMHNAYNYVIWAYNIIFAIIISLCLEPQQQPAVFIYYIFTTLLYSLEIIIKALAFSSNKRISYGLASYFKLKWNLFDFVLLIISYFDILCIALGTLEYLPKLHQLYLAFYIGELRLFKCFVLFQSLYSTLLLAIEYKMDTKICFGYDIATALVNCCDEVLLSIEHIIEVNIVRNFYIKQLQLEKFEVIRIMEEVQSERPYIAITAKTKQACRTTLSAMIDSLNDLKVSGFVDNVEYIYIYKEIFDKQKFLMNLKFVKPNHPKLLFFEVPWMVNDLVVKDYLFRHAENVFWNKGEVVCKDGRSPHGIYVFVGGLLKLKYTPKLSTVKDIKTFGTLPIVDYYGSCKFQEEWEDRITSGNSVGELSLLTGRPYDCDIIADSSSQAFFLTTEVIHNAMKLSKNPIHGLEARMWKYSTINLAVAILSNAPLYQTMTQEQIKFKLQRAFMPNLSCYKMFVITDMMDDVILMEGMAADYNYGNIFIAPMHLPRTTQKLILPKSSYLDLDDKIVVKLLVIPVENAKQTEIMLEEEELAELVQSPSSSCLLRLVEGQRQEIFKMHRQKNVEPLLVKESYFSLTNFNAASKDKFEVLESAPSSSDSTSASQLNKGNLLQLITQNKTFTELEVSEESSQ